MESINVVLPEKFPLASERSFRILEVVVVDMIDRAEE